MQVYDLLTGKPMELQPSDHMYYYLNNIYFKIKAALVNITVFKSPCFFCTLFFSFK